MDGSSAAGVTPGSSVNPVPGVEVTVVPTTVQAPTTIPANIPVFVPREVPVAPVLSEEQRASAQQVDDILGRTDGLHLTAVVTLPSAEDKTLAEAKSVEDALPLIGNMIKAEKAAAAGPRKPYPRAALKQQHIVAFMLCNPFATTTEICSFFNISPTTLSNITKSDTFKSLVAAHRVSIESGIGADLQAQLRDTMAAAVEVVQKAVVAGQDPDYALEVLDKTANRLGMGAKHQSGPMVQVNVVTPEMIAAARAARRLAP